MNKYKLTENMRVLKTLDTENTCYVQQTYMNTVGTTEITDNTKNNGHRFNINSKKIT